ncbi:MAG: zinc ribbon domain-containing protein [Methanobrevibacter millerae]|uniref:Zinc ribbon domain-containing protein n=1 Tax=Methanobrevibacter millerae TaxID=230361 RepID=A0A8T3VAQ6_9EURY|nr:zinc ribbon domain-containing protein [Methanobrevibacter millerae]MBE6505088.1 zinc ribbon domain-containing protein [Methanobrevibacter millerae]
MSKTCPNCGVNSPDNAKFCIECAESLEGVPINKEETVKKAPSTSSSDDNGSVIPCIIGIIIVVIIVVAAAAFIFNSGSGEETQKNITVTFSDVYVSSGNSISGIFYYYYYVNGFFNNFPEDMEGYTVKTLYCDKEDKELVSTTEKLSYFESSKDSKYDTMISSYSTPNYLDVDHVKVQIIKDGNVLNEFTANMNTNKLTQSSSSAPTNNSSK